MMIFVINIAGWWGRNSTEISEREGFILRFDPNPMPWVKVAQHRQSSCMWIVPDRFPDDPEEEDKEHED